MVPVRERRLGGPGVLISLGVYFAYDWSAAIVSALPTYFVFFIPAAVLALFFAIDLFVIRDSPSKAGFEDFDTADASSGDTGPPLGVVGVFKRMITNPVIVIILSIEFCSGFLRNAIMQWGRKYAVQTGLADGSFISTTACACVAGILAACCRGHLRPRLLLAARAGLRCSTADADRRHHHRLPCRSPAPRLVGRVMSLCVIEPRHALGTASTTRRQKNAGVAVGIIEAVYWHNAQSVLWCEILLAVLQPTRQLTSWPLAMIPSPWSASC